MVFLWAMCMSNFRGLYLVLVSYPCSRDNRGRKKYFVRIFSHLFKHFLAHEPNCTSKSLFYQKHLLKKFASINTKSN